MRKRRDLRPIQNLTSVHFELPINQFWNIAFIASLKSYIETCFLINGVSVPLLCLLLAVRVYTFVYGNVLLHTSTYAIVLYFTQPAVEPDPEPKKQPKIRSSEFAQKLANKAKQQN